MTMNSATTWESLLDAPGACDHLVQLYTDDEFLARAVVHFVRAGFDGGEAAVIIATPGHIALFSERLPEVSEALAQRQLVFLDADECLKTFMVDGTPDRQAFLVTVTAALQRVRAAGYPRMRLYGEMVNLLWQRDALDAAVRLEELWNELLAVERLPLLCAYRIDNFDRHAHRRALGPIGKVHSHMIPLEHYDRLERAVERAYFDVFGPDGDAQTLRELLVTSLGPTSAMPRAQAALLALRGVNAHTADAVLDRAKLYYSEA
ncbi:MAG TPA: MEDS domain-containing protein [Candidatus Acidoferrum sp.]|nr:MEDS domain-containing protein [Candidatus Acidoferrum sp.]